MKRLLQLVVILFFGLLFAGRAAAADEESVANAIRTLGAKVTVDETRPGKPVISIDFTGAKITDDALKDLKVFKQLTELNLKDTDVTNASMKFLKELKGLEKLNLFVSGINNDGIKELGELINLTELEIGNNEMDDEALVHLKGMQKLKSLKLTYTRVTGSGFGVLAGLKKLETLDLEDSDVNAEGAVGLKGLTNLKVLNLGSTGIGDQGMVELEKLTNLEELDLSFPHSEITDLVFESIVEFKKLRILNLERAKVTDVGLNDLLELKNLESLNLTATEITNKGLRTLKKLQTLKSLSLSETKVTDAGLKELRELKHLQELSLVDTQVTDSGLKLLKELAGLKSISLGSPSITDAGLPELRQFKQLDQLTLKNAAVTDAGLKSLLTLQTLKVLELTDTAVTDAGLRQLKELKKLEFLFVSGKQVTKEGSEKLKTLLPKLEVTYLYTQPAAESIPADPVPPEEVAKPQDVQPTKEVVSTIGIKLRLIPAGQFHMGAPRAEEGQSSLQGQQRVTITKPFYLGTYEVTQAEYRKVIGHDPSWFAKTGLKAEQVRGLKTDRFPVESVSWFDAIAFCNKLSELEKLPPYYRLEAIKRETSTEIYFNSITEAKLTILRGAGYRLPTEAEWEYACRAGTVTAFHFGTKSNGQESNINGEQPLGTTTKGPFLRRPTVVGSYPANKFGLHDMHGNVDEWCENWARDETAEMLKRPFSEAGRPKPDAVDPQGPTTGEYRALRGGDFSSHAAGARSAEFGRQTPGRMGEGIGFRVARDGPVTPQKETSLPVKDQK